jgi:hypothetical protein
VANALPPLAVSGALGSHLTGPGAGSNDGRRSLLAGGTILSDELAKHVETPRNSVAIDGLAGSSKSFGDNVYDVSVRISRDSARDLDSLSSVSTKALVFKGPPRPFHTFDTFYLEAELSEQGLLDNQPGGPTTEVSVELEGKQGISPSDSTQSARKRRQIAGVSAKNSLGLSNEEVAQFGRDERHYTGGAQAGKLSDAPGRGKHPRQSHFERKKRMQADSSS